MKPQYLMIGLAFGVAVADPVSVQAQSTIEPPESCLVDEEALQACLDTGTITQDQFAQYRPLAKYNGARKLADKRSAQHRLFEIPSRCGDDTLNEQQAKGRMAWAQKCVPYQNASVKSLLAEYATKTMQGRPYYVTFMKLEADGSFTRPSPGYVAPVSADAPCDLPDDYRIAARCVAGCYAPGDEVLTPVGYQPVDRLEERALKQVITLQSGSTLDQLKWKASEIDYVVKSLEDSKHELLEISTENGNRLRVTKNHPLVLFTGEVVEASTLKVGSQLVTAEGNPDPIRSVIPFTYFGKVYNLSLPTQDRAENVVLAQGVLNGSVFYQNEAANLLNRRLFRDEIEVKAVVR